MDTWQFWSALICVGMGMIYCTVGMVMRLYSKQRTFADLLLCIAFLCTTWHIFIYVLIYTGEIIAYPFLYNKGIPLYYLISPCFYFYVYFKLYPDRQLPRYWYLHLIPFVFGLIDIVPYAISSAQSQKQLLEIVVSDLQMGFKHSFGFIDQKWHYVLRFGLGFIYIIAQWRLLYRFQGAISLDEKDKTYRQTKISIFNTVYSVYYSAQASMVLAVLLNRIHGSFILRSIDKLLPVSLLFLLFTTWFFFSSLPSFREWFYKRQVSARKPLSINE